MRFVSVASDCQASAGRTPTAPAGGGSRVDRVSHRSIQGDEPAASHAQRHVVSLSADGDPFIGRQRCHYVQRAFGLLDRVQDRLGISRHRHRLRLLVDAVP